MPTAVILLSIIFAAESTNAGHSIDLAALDGWDIVVGKHATVTEQYAAKELQEALQHVTGVTLPVQKHFSRPDRHFFVGPSLSMQNASVGFKTEGFGEEELRIVVGKRNIAIAGGRPRGTLYGVYEFLENYLDVRFLTGDHTHAPRVRRPHLLAPVDQRYHPPLKFRWSFYRETNANPPFATRMRINTVGTGCSESVPSAPKLGGKSSIRLINHSFFQQVSSLKYGRAHPEYYCMRDGQRWLENPHDRRRQDRQNQPCMTNQEVLSIVTKETLAELNSLTDYDTVSVSQNDNEQFCECDSCQEINARENAPSGSLLQFVNAVADVAILEHPQREIGTLAYQFSRKPPAKLRPRSNVRIQLCSIECCVNHPLDDPNCPRNAAFMRDLEGWGRLTERLSIWHYHVNFSDYTLTYPSLYWLDHNVRLYVKHHADGIFMQAAGETVSAALSDLNNYVIARVLWDPSQDAREVAGEFIRLHYGSAASPIQRFVDLIHKRALSSGLHAHCFGGAARFGLDDPEIAQFGLDIFSEALDLADNLKIRQRVEKASIAALRLALEPAYVATKSDQPLSPAEVEYLRPLARRYFELCSTYGVDTLKSDGRGIPWAKEQLQSVLGPW